MKTDGFTHTTKRKALRRTEDAEPVVSPEAAGFLRLLEPANCSRLSPRRTGTGRPPEVTLELWNPAVRDTFTLSIRLGPSPRSSP